jgi:multidrug efflux pump subunit AcrA (membrane-fusion protein)
MGQLGWMFSIIPDAILNWLYWAIIVIGITGMFAGWFSKFIPVYGRYIGFIKPVGIALVILGVWLRGGYDTEMAWRNKVKEAEAKVAAAEVKSKETNVVVKKVYVDRVQKVKELQIVYQDRIKEVEKRIDAECKVAPEAIGILNDAAKLRKGTVTISPLEPVGDKK